MEIQATTIKPARAQPPVAPVRPSADPPRADRPVRVAGSEVGLSRPTVSRLGAEGRELIVVERLAAGESGQDRRRPAPAETRLPAGGASAPPTAPAPGADGPDGLTEAERAQVDELRDRDREVRAHEAAHARVGGPHAGSPSFTFQTGPDGRAYAIGGSVPIDIAPVPGDPEATIAKMTVVKAAALAPAEPSAADRRIAAIAESQRLEARAEARRPPAEPAQDARLAEASRILAGRGAGAELDRRI